MPAPISLLCLPCAGASATMYLRWRRLLPAWIRLVPVELPGRGARLAENFIENFDHMVTLLCTEQAEAMRGSFAIFGHSMGALLAYGMTQRLRASGKRLPQALLVSGSPAPSQRDIERFPDKHDDAALIAELRKQGGTPEEVYESEELMRITLDVLGADYRICETFCYMSSSPLKLPLHVFGGKADDIEAERIDAWSVEAGANFNLVWFDTGHLLILY